MICQYLEKVLNIVIEQKKRYHDIQYYRVIAQAYVHEFIQELLRAFYLVKYRGCYYLFIMHYLRGMYAAISPQELTNF